ncbi:MAG TPA: S9 family peptidase [Armatimonadota bacterium]|jgi:dipeptidyl aminopeptidase/acylaminoacyl peptidase
MKIPLEVLFGNPTRVRPALSPDGRTLAWIAPLDGVLNVYTRALDGGEERAVTRDTGRGICAYAWAHDGEHLLYIQDRDGDENWHVYAVRVADGETRDLTPHPGIQAQILAIEKDVPDRILVGLNLRNATLHEPYEIRLADGESRIVAENPGDVAEWGADAKLAVRAALAQTEDAGWDLRARDSADGPWRSVHRVGPEDEASPVTFTEDGSGLYLLTTKGSNAKRVALLDLASGDERALAQREDADVAGLAFHPVTRTLQAVAFARHRQEWVVLDEDIRADFEALKAAADGDFDVVSRSDDDSLWIVAFTRDIGPAHYYLYRRAGRATEFLFSARPALEEYPLSPMGTVDIPARDGLVLPGYLTLPLGVEPVALPLVLNVHGGPWARDSWGYDAEAQWFANRGYACLQVNFRASQGFGKAFERAGDREWGGKMLDDLIDAVQWAINQGVADPKRVAIYGGSYGGYAVLSALAFRPEVFACGVDIVGPSNLITFLNSIPPYWEVVRRMFDDRVGNVDRDEQFLKDRSPLFSVARIVRPLFIAQGAHDPRVVQAESEQIVAALRDAGKPVEYMLFPDEGHGFARPENRLKFYAAAEGFLEKWLGAR